MKSFLTTLACAAALGATGAAHAALITFDDPGVIAIDGDAARYTEAGYAIGGPATSFLLIGEPPTAGVLVGGFADTPSFGLTAAGGGAFALLGFDYGFFDLGVEPGSLTVTGLFDGLPVGELALSLGSTTRVALGAAFASVTEVRFSATSGFLLDNVSAVPEPGTLALASVALVAGLGAARRRRPGTTPARAPT